MAGHSKWANIQHRKKAQDKKRGKIFTKLIREITVAARLGGGEPANNPRLRAAIDAGLSANMPKDNIERAIKKGAGTQDGDNFEEIRYEGYGPGGIAIIVDCLSDNRNRTVAEVRHAFTKYGGNLGTDGSVAYLFKHCGQMAFAEGADEEKIMDAAIEAGADDVVVNDDGSIDVITAFADYLTVKDALTAAELTPEHAAVTMLPENYIELDKDKAEKLMKMVDVLEDLDDVQNVYTNANISADILAELGE